MLEQKDLIQFLSTHKQQWFAEFRLTKLGLLGSFARNETTEQSDIDIIVDFLPNTPHLTDKKAAIKEIISQTFHRKVDICREKYLKPYYKDHILKTVIYV